MTDMLRPFFLFLLLGAVATANLLSNPGFESWPDDSTPAGWTVESRTRTRVTRESDTARGGAYGARFVRLELSSGGNNGLVQRAPVRPGGEYDFRVWCRDDDGEVKLGVGLSWRRADSSYISSTGIAYSIDSVGWQMVAGHATAPAEAAWADFRVRTYAPAGMTGPRRVLVDDASLPAYCPPGDSVCTWFAQDSLGEKLIAFFAGARASIDYCCYNSSRPDVVQALLAAHSRGVHVRVITDNRRLENTWVVQLRSAGVVVWSDSIGPHASNYMHNKFAVRDLADADSTNDRLWVASYNPNDGELRADCAIEIPHTGLAQAYRAEFEQMWGGSGPNPDPAYAVFHTGKTDVLATHRYELNGYTVEVYFAPQDRPVDTIAARAAAAQRHLLFGVFSFTHDNLGIEMVRLWQDSVWVGGVIDRSGIRSQGTEYPRLLAAGVPVYEDSVPFGEKILHEKLMVIDSTVTVVGSANWSNNGNRLNDENSLILHDPRLARRFLAELHERFYEATHPGVAEGTTVRFEPGRVGGIATAVGLASRAAHAEVFDVRGRRVRRPDRVAPGIYFLLQPGRPAARVVVVRR